MADLRNDMCTGNSWKLYSTKRLRVHNTNTVYEYKCPDPACPMKYAYTLRQRPTPGMYLNEDVTRKGGPSCCAQRFGCPYDPSNATLNTMTPKEAIKRIAEIFGKDIPHTKQLKSVLA